MGITILTVVAVVVLAVIAFRRGPDRAVAANKPAKWLLGAALVLMGLYVALLLFFGLGEMMSGDFSGIIHLTPAIMVIVLMWLVWRRPVETGIVLVIVGVLAAFYYGAAAMQGGGPFLAGVLIGGAPYLAAGLAALAAAAMARRRAANAPTGL